MFGAGGQGAGTCKCWLRAALWRHQGLQANTGHSRPCLGIALVTKNALRGLMGLVCLFPCPTSRPTAPGALNPVQTILVLLQAQKWQEKLERQRGLIFEAP